MALWEKEGQQIKCALSLEQSRGKLCIACPGLAGANTLEPPAQ